MRKSGANVDVKRAGADVGSYSSGVGVRRLRYGAESCRPIAQTIRPVRPTARNLVRLLKQEYSGKPAEAGFPDKQFNLAP